MAYVSKWRFAKISPRKARLLTDLIRGKTVAEAMDLLKFSKQRGAVMVGKVLKSAVANADEKEADVEDLYVAGSFCDAGPIVKRMQPKDRGKSYAIFKRTCHITVAVDEGAERRLAAKKALKMERQKRGNARRNAPAAGAAVAITTVSAGRTVTDKANV